MTADQLPGDVDRDATLDAFGAGTGADDAEPESAADGSEETGTEARERSEGSEPPVPTTDWSPDGAACADCGAVVERRWRQDGALVCPDCKDWNRP